VCGTFLTAYEKNSWLRLCTSEVNGICIYDCMDLFSLAFLIQYRRVTDTHTDTQTHDDSIGLYRARIASRGKMFYVLQLSSQIV